MSSNPLNDLSQVYIDQIANLKKAETQADIKRWEEIGGPTPTNYKPTGNSAKIKTEEKVFKSNWRVELNDDYQGDPSASIPVFPGGEKQAAKKVKDVKGIKNKIEINPKLPEAVEQMGGQLIEATEVDPIILSAVDYFYEEGINEEGLELLIEEIGLEAFVDFVEGGAVELNEERDARRASVRAKKFDVVKKEVDKADAARKASKKGEYAPSYAKKETDVTVYDDKPAAKKKVVAKKPAAPAKPAAPKKPAVPAKPAAPKKPVAKKVVKAVAKVKKAQPVKKPSKAGLTDRIRSAYKAGVKRHRKATQVPRVFAKGAVAGAKKTVKFAKDVKKAVVGEEAVNEKISASGYARAKKWREDQAREKDRKENEYFAKKAKTHKWDGEKWNKRENVSEEELLEKDTYTMKDGSGKKYEFGTHPAFKPGAKKPKSKVKPFKTEYDPSDDDTFDPHEAEATRGQSGRGTTGKMNVRKKYPVKEATDAQLKSQEKGVFELEKKEANANRAKALKKRQQELSKEGSSNWRDELLNEVEVSKLDDKRSKAAREAMLQALEQQAIKKKKQLAKEANDPAREHLIQRKQLMLDRQKLKLRMKAQSAAKKSVQQDREQKQDTSSLDAQANIVASEAKIDTGTAAEKASARNKRNTPAGKDYKFDTSVFITRKPGESLDSARTRTRQKAHAAKRGLKEDRALDIVRANIIKKHGKGAIYDVKRDKPTEAQKKSAAAERQKRQAEKNKAFADRAKKAGYKSTQDYANVVARYGSEENMKKGKGLGT